MLVPDLHFFCITLEACPGIPRDLGWSCLWQKLMAGSHFCHNELRLRFCGVAWHASDHFRNPHILLNFLWGWVYGSRGAFAVVYTNQCLSIDGETHEGLILFDGEKHEGWIFFTNVA